MGIHVTGLHGAGATRRAAAPSYPAETFTGSLTATEAELSEHSTALTKRLVAPMLRRLGTEWVLRQYSGPDDAGRLDG